MKKILLILVLIAFSITLAWALPDQAAPTEITSSQGPAISIKATSGTVYLMSVSYVGVTAGDKIQIIDGASAINGTGGTVRLTCVASAANGTCPVPLSVGAYFATNIYLKETRTGGNFFTDVQYF